jgi:hypothetical protein
MNGFKLKFSALPPDSFDMKLQCPDHKKLLDFQQKQLIRLKNLSF